MKGDRPDVLVKEVGISPTSLFLKVGGDILRAVGGVRGYDLVGIKTQGNKATLTYEKRRCGGAR
jgi:hypothetical protein